MQYELQRVSVGQVFRLAFCLTLIIALPVTAIVMLISYFNQPTAQPVPEPVPWYAVLLMLILYPLQVALAAAVISAVQCWMYNLLATRSPRMRIQVDLIQRADRADSESGLSNGST